jgi:hypothetical protein
MLCFVKLLPLAWHSTHSTTVNIMKHFIPPTSMVALRLSYQPNLMQMLSSIRFDRSNILPSVTSWAQHAHSMTTRLSRSKATLVDVLTHQNKTGDRGASIAVKGNLSPVGPTSSSTIKPRATRLRPKPAAAPTPRAGAEQLSGVLPTAAPRVFSDCACLAEALRHVCAADPVLAELVASGQLAPPQEGEGGDAKAADAGPLQGLQQVAGPH